MKIASSKTIRELENTAHAAVRCGGPTLMEQASMHCARRIHDFKNSRCALNGYEIIILAGRGNNGGDGILTGSYLARFFNEKVSIFSLQTPNEMSDEIRRHFFSLPSDLSVNFVKHPSNFPDLKKPCIIVDALLGIGFKGELRGIVRDLINSVNSSNNPVISIDVPSGIETDSGIGKDAVYADLTITIGAEKAGLYINDGRIHSGIVDFADIGFDLSKIPDEDAVFEVTPSDILHRIYRRRKTELYKTLNGKLLVIGGSTVYPGAVVLAAMGASSAGCGMLTTAIKAHPFSVLAPDIIIRDYSKDGEKCFNKNDIADLITLASRQNAVVFGMGVTANSDTKDVLKELLSLPQKLLLDADALNTLAMFPELWQHKKHSDIIITPHAQEAYRLAQSFNIENFSSMSRLEQISALSAELDCTVVLKGDKTLIASPDRKIWVNQKGSCALAKGGSGDVLSGIIGALLARENDLSCHEIAAAGVLLHSISADFAAQSRSAFSISDLPDAVRKYLNSITIF